MFWARVESLRPLFDLKLTWDDYPNEPVPRDGTLLHAIERIFPQVVSSTGKTIAVTHVPGVTRLR
jgi:lipopolysaccharide biosynthesis protein